MDFLLFFFSKSATPVSTTSRASEPLRTTSSTRSTYETFSDKSKPGHRKALFDRVSDDEPGGWSMSRSTSTRRGPDVCGVASLDLILLMDRHRFFS
jgi:hypothetical protein